MDELEDESIETEVRGGDAQGRVELVELRGRFIERGVLVPELEAEHLLVEALRALQVGDDLPSVVVDAQWSEAAVFERSEVSSLQPFRFGEEFARRTTEHDGAAIEYRG